MGYIWIDYREVADWLREDPDRCWTINDDPMLSSMLNFPATGAELADAVESLGVDLLVFEHCIETVELDTQVSKLLWANGSEWVRWAHGDGQLCIKGEETTDA